MSCNAAEKVLVPDASNIYHNITLSWYPHNHTFLNTTDRRRNKNSCFNFSTRRARRNLRPNVKFVEVGNHLRQLVIIS